MQKNNRFSANSFCYINEIFHTGCQQKQLKVSMESSLVCGLLIFLAIVVTECSSAKLPNYNDDARDKSTSCSRMFDFGTQGSCFKYVGDKLLTKVDAERYCERNFHNGRLAHLQTDEKYRSVMKHFYRVFRQERKTYDSTPTAWIDGVWIPGTKSILYSDLSVDSASSWMPKTKVSGNDVITWPTNRFGYDAICVAVSLWQREMLGLGVKEISGMYNVYCNKLYRTHPLCEVTM
uniref:uncharacterized protein LOC120326523 n=1 Tax=Styela clava TaxID=7725 RepID=UPI001939A2D1|nr:uncharacterized protein LOC120326523 [Styela clava]